MGQLSEIRDLLRRSTYWPVWLGRLVWRAKNLVGLWARGVISPLHDSQQWTGLMVAAVAAYGALSSGIPQKMVAQFEVMTTWQGTLITAVPIWVVVNLVFAHFKRRQQEAASGTWSGPKFIYNEPLLIGTVGWTPEDNGTWKKINVRGPEANSFVMLHIEHYPPTNRVRAQVVHVWNQMMFGAANGLQRQSIGTRVNNGRLWVVAESLPATIPVTLRVYCHSFELGKGGVADIDPYIPG